MIWSGSGCRCRGSVPGTGSNSSYTGPIFRGRGVSLRRERIGIVAGGGTGRAYVGVCERLLGGVACLLTSGIEPVCHSNWFRTGVRVGRRRVGVADLRDMMCTDAGGGTGRGSFDVGVSKTSSSSPSKIGGLALDPVCPEKPPNASLRPSLQPTSLALLVSSASRSF